MTVTIGRRELLAALGGAVPWPFAARARSKTRPTLAGYTAKHNQQVNKHAGLPLGALFAALVVSGLPGSPKPRHQIPFPATFPKSAASTLPELRQTRTAPTHKTKMRGAVNSKPRQ